ncbi:hypothetical protein, partial [Gordonia sputi]
APRLYPVRSRCLTTFPRPAGLSRNPPRRDRMVLIGSRIRPRAARINDWARPTDARSGRMSVRGISDLFIDVACVEQARRPHAGSTRQVRGAFEDRSQ